MKAGLRGFHPLRSLACVLLLALPLGSLCAAQITDVRGRQVSVPEPVQRLSIDDARYLVALALIVPDPVKPLAAWAHDKRRLTGPIYAELVRRFPRLATLPRVASSKQPFNMEAVLAAAPDVAVVSLQSNITDQQVAQLQAVGIPVVFIDFFMHPARNQALSLRILGQLTGSQAQADAYIAFRAEHLAKITRRVAKLPADDRPSVLMEAHAGISPDCCFSPGKGNMDRYIRMAGGHNIGADVLNSATGKLSLEYVMASNPEVYVATGGASLAKHGGLVLGAGFDRAEAVRTLKAVTRRKGIAGLTAVTSGHAYGLAHQLINSPLDVVAIEALAKWIHPDLFADIDPQATLKQINRRFLAVPYRGTFWVALP